MISGEKMPRTRIAVRKPLLQAYVVERLAYIDSLFARSTKKLDPVDLKRLKRTLIHDDRFPWKRYFGQRREFVNRTTGEILYHYVHLIHQPTRATIQVLQDIQDRNPSLLHILEVQCALDLTTASESDAKQLHESFLSVYTPARLAETDHDQEHGTSYMGRRGSGNEVAVYSDGKRKVRPGSPRVHIEWRITGATALRRANIKSASDLARIDHKTFWRKRLRLNIMPALPRLMRVLELRAVRRGRPLSTELRERTLNLLSRMSRDYRGRFTAQGLDNYLVSGLHPKPSQLYVRISNEWALPRASNALWDEE